MDQTRSNGFMKYSLKVEYFIVLKKVNSSGRSQE